MPNDNMPDYLKLPLAIEIILVAVEAICPYSHSVLPLGGSPIAQAGTLVLMGIASHEIVQSVIRRK